MVRHGILVSGVDMNPAPVTTGERKPPVILQMNDDDFPARFLQDLATPPSQPAVSSAEVVTAGPLFQPVQRIMHVAMVRLNCDTFGFPRVDPTRILSSGLVIRRVYRPRIVPGAPAPEAHPMAAWVRCSGTGQFKWMRLAPDQKDCDPDPALRKKLMSGQAALDLQLAALNQASGYTESSTPAFAAPPATCAALNHTIVYAVVPTASSDVSAPPAAPASTLEGPVLLGTLPPLLRAAASAPTPPAPGQPVNYCWMTDDFLNSFYQVNTPGASTAQVSAAENQVAAFQAFSTALRMLNSVFNAFSSTQEGNAILAILNRHNVTFTPSGGPATQQPMGQFYLAAKQALLDPDPYPTPSANPPSVTMPDAWDPLTAGDETDLVTAMLAALTPQLTSFLAPQGRFQDSTRDYRLRFFFRLKPENPCCPPDLVWSRYSEPFKIAPWYEGGRSHAPIPLPDPGPDFLKKLKHNCAFQVPGNMMSALQGTTMSGLMNGSGSSSKMNLDWICSFSIPLITICAFFVLNIFLILLNIVFFWLPFIKICIPIPVPSSSQPDD